MATGHDIMRDADLGWDTSHSNELALQQMYQLETLQWNGGENFFDGTHHGFCDVCAGTMELFECQTCEASYHSSCMSPTLQPDDVPTFWFCPHCVDRELHIPPEPGNGLPDVSLYLSPSSTEVTQESAISTGTMTSASIAKSKDNITIRTSTTKTQPQRQTAAFSKIKPARSRPRRTYSPPRKRSKYSSLSSEVDKALAVIQKELETAANIGRTEDELRDTIKALEQQLKLKDGQIMLAHRELEMARKEPGLAELKKQNSTLMMEVEKKDAELQDWRTKLRGMLGSDG